MKKKKLVFICSPYKGDTEQNTEDALQYCAGAFLAGYIPIAPHVYFTRFANDNNKKQRRAGIDAGKQLLLLCSEVWAFGLDKPSKGMIEELATAIRAGIRVYDGELKLKAEHVDARLAVHKTLLHSVFQPILDTIANAFRPLYDQLLALQLPDLQNGGGKK